MINIGLSWNSDQKEDGEYFNQIKFSCGTQSVKNKESKRGINWTFKCEPVSFVHLLHRRDAKCEVKNGELIATSQSVKIQVNEKTGRIIRFTLLGNTDVLPDAGSRLTFRQHAFKARVDEIHHEKHKFKECFDERKPITSVAKFGLTRGP